jgi:hypothetical protein
MKITVVCVVTPWDPNISVRYIASILRIKNQISACSLNMLFAWFILWLWRWRLYVSLNVGLSMNYRALQASIHLKVITYCHVSGVPRRIITGSRLDDWIYWQLLQINLNYSRYSAIADLHNLLFTVIYALGFSVSTSRILATDLNIETITSNHYEVFLPFLVHSPSTADSPELEPILQF